MLNDGEQKAISKGYVSERRNGRNCLKRQMTKDKNTARHYSSQNKMIWLAYAGLCIVGIGCFVLMIALMEYPGIEQNFAEELAQLEQCRSLSGSEAEDCNKYTTVALTYLSGRQADNYRTLVLGAIGIGSGMALFITCSARPSWFSHISAETAE